MAQDPRALLQKVGVYPSIQILIRSLYLRHDRQRKQRLALEVDSPYLADDKRSGRVLQNCTIKQQMRSACQSRVSFPARIFETPNLMPINRQGSRSSIRKSCRHPNEQIERTRRCRQHPHRSLQGIPKDRPSRCSTLLRRCNQPLYF